MKILGIDSSAKAASVAITDEGKVISSFYINTGLTHSQTLMPMINDALKCADVSLDSVDLIAVNKGPGSFTGIRIGVSAAKGMADVKSIKCFGASTLESMAYNMIDFDCVVCSVMDARCNQVYCALFDITDRKVTRLTEDTAISIDEVGEIIKKYNKIKFFVGDGAEICYNALGSNDDSIRLPSQALRFQNATGVCFVAANHDEKEYIISSQLVPEYLRLPQAERELNKKLKK